MLSILSLILALIREKTMFWNMCQFSPSRFGEINVILLTKSSFSADRETVKSMEACDQWINPLYFHKWSTYSRRVSMALASDLSGKFVSSLPFSLGVAQWTVKWSPISQIGHFSFAWVSPVNCRHYSITSQFSSTQYRRRSLWRRLSVGYFAHLLLLLLLLLLLRRLVFKTTCSACVCSLHFLLQRNEITVLEYVFT